MGREKGVGGQCNLWYDDKTCVTKDRGDRGAGHGGLREREKEGGVARGVEIDWLVEKK